ncbi:MAG: hypothetical protein RJQ09_13150 [Cyclobacteriaceae bacterium]
MAKNIIISTLIIVLFGCDPDTTDSPAPEDVFVKFHGNAGVTSVIDFLLHPDPNNDGYVIFGSTDSQVMKTDIDDTDTDFLLIFTDNQGNEIDNGRISYDAGPENNAVPKKIISTQDGGFLMVGSVDILINGTDSIINANNQTERFDFINEPVTRAFVQKVDANGAHQWNFIYPSDVNLVAASTSLFRDDAVPSSEIANGVIQASDGNFILIGRSTQVNIQKPDFGDGTTDVADIWVLKFDQAGIQITETGEASGIIFERRLGFPGEDEGIDIFERSDGQLTMIGNGEGETNENGKDILYVTSDANAFNNNFQEYGTLEDDIVTSVELLSDNGVAVVGYTQSQGDKTIVARFNSVGTEEFFKTIELNQREAFDSNDSRSQIEWSGTHRGHGITQMQNGSFAIVGQLDNVSVTDNTIANASSADRGSDMLFFTINGFGEISPNSVQRQFGGTQDNDVGIAVRHLIDGRFVLVGNMDLVDGDMITIIKTNSRGNITR